MPTVKFHTRAKGLPQLQLSHTPAAIGAAFDDPNLIASAGLVPLTEPRAFRRWSPRTSGSRRTRARTRTLKR
jgi:hypothetical protein